jgi:hypothetical protein
MKIILGAHFDTDEADEIKATAKSVDLTIAQLIRRAVREYVNRYRPLQSPTEQSEVQEQAA